MKRFQAKSTFSVYKYILPGLILFCVAVAVPLFSCLAISFTNWAGGSNFDFVGFDNYIQLVQDEDFWEAFLNNLQMIITLMISQIGIGFLLALFFQSKKVIVKEFHRRLIFLPAVLAPIVVGMLWQMVYRRDIGLISSFLQIFGFDGNLPWLDSIYWVIPSICLTLTWQFMGQYTIILMAGMQNVGTEIVEAAKIDGATSAQTARYIIFPLLKPTIAVCMLMCISGCMKMFDIIFIMSGGGPGTASMVTALYAYNIAFKSYKMGYASSVAIGMTLLSLGMILVSQLLLSGRKSNE